MLFVFLFSFVNLRSFRWQGILSLQPESVAFDPKEKWVNFYFRTNCH